MKSIKLMKSYADKLDKLSKKLDKDIKKHLPKDCQLYAVMAYDRLKHDVVRYLSEAARSLKYYARKHQNH